MEFVSSVNWALLNLTCVTDELDNIMNLSRTDMVIYVLERFIILMFDRTSEHTDLDSARNSFSQRRAEHLITCHQHRMLSAAH